MLTGSPITRHSITRSPNVCRMASKSALNERLSRVRRGWAEWFSASVTATPIRRAPKSKAAIAMSGTRHAIPLRLVNNTSEVQLVNDHSNPCQHFSNRLRFAPMGLRGASGLIRPRALVALAVALFATVAALHMFWGTGAPPGADDALIAAGTSDVDAYLENVDSIDPAPPPIAIQTDLERTANIERYLVQAGLSRQDAHSWATYFQSVAQTNLLRKGHPITIYKDSETGAVTGFKYDVDDRVSDLRIDARRRHRQGVSAADQLHRAPCQPRVRATRQQLPRCCATSSTSAADRRFHRGRVFRPVRPRSGGGRDGGKADLR